ncbi:hypothetical protein DERP_014395 [Dermatophagoides pteronyssinus]|uniref:Uncharacterized protein n=1 Tax=Dermatophagoides pteronyssinus TaxID=6956 RepID=A0ABQ8J5Y7_DERPT|nr:hypothetical protein DERP_014395 [Dermatophagoides pteronyssinus]
MANLASFDTSRFERYFTNTNIIIPEIINFKNCLKNFVIKLFESIDECINSICQQSIDNIKLCNIDLHGSNVEFRNVVNE